MTIFLLLAGLVLLIVGAEALVRGASRLAALIGISPLIIGLTVVAYGTSAPEMAVSVFSNLSGQADISLGNVVGSNIFNVLFILGLSALIMPLKVSPQMVKFDVPVMIVASVLVLVLGLDGRVSQFEGLLLFAGLVIYTFVLITQSRRQSAEILAEYEREYADGKKRGSRKWYVYLAMILVGLGLLVLGSRWLVESAVVIARYFAVSELVIGLTVVAAGTSLPEVATSVVAALRGERDIAVGNVVGSNIFNILGVLGLSGLVSARGVGVTLSALQYDIPVMIAVAVACLPVFLTGQIISRWEGGMFLVYYLAYTTFLILTATGHSLLPAFTAFIGTVALPLTGLALIITTVRALRSGSPTG